MSVLAMIEVARWDEACLAGTPIDERPWIAHLVARLARSPVVSRVAVVCHPACHALVAPHVPAGVDLVGAADPIAWAAADGADLIARVPVWQLFADPARLARLSRAPRPAGTTLVRAVLERDDAVVLSGGTEVELLTALGARRAAAGEDVSGGIVTVPGLPDPPELRLRGAKDAGWGRTLQRALIGAGRVADLTAVEVVMRDAGLHRVDMWRDGAGRAPQRILTVRCQPAALFAWLVAHLARLPGARIDVVCPEALAEATRAHPAVHQVIPYSGASFDLAALAPAALAAIRARRYDLCVVPRRTACGRGFENVTPLGAASEAAVAVWMDVTGTTGLLAGRPGGWDPWIQDVPPWRAGTDLRARAQTAFHRVTGTPLPAPPRPSASDLVTAIVRRMDEAVVCHALSDAPDHGLDLAPVFVHQLPGVAAAQDAVAAATAAGRPAAGRLRTLVDRALVDVVEELAAAPAGRAAREAGEAARRHTTAIAAQAAAVAAAADGSAMEQRALAAFEVLGASPSWSRGV